MRILTLALLDHGDLLAHLLRVISTGIPDYFKKESPLAAAKRVRMKTRGSPCALPPSSLSSARGRSARAGPTGQIHQIRVHDPHEGRNPPLYRRLRTKNRPGKHPILLERTGSARGLTARTDTGDTGISEIRREWLHLRRSGRARPGPLRRRLRPRSTQLLNPLKPHDIDESTDATIPSTSSSRRSPTITGASGCGVSPIAASTPQSEPSTPIPPFAPPRRRPPVSDWFLGDDFRHNGALF